MNAKLVESIVQLINTLSEEEQALLKEKTSKTLTDFVLYKVRFKDRHGVVAFRA